MLCNMAGFTCGVQLGLVITLMTWSTSMGDTSCLSVSSVETLEVGLSTRGLVQLHVRSNIQVGVKQNIL